LKNKILFITHEASRTGAPMVILHLIKWLQTNSDYCIDLLSLKGGELSDEFSEIVNEYYVLPKPRKTKPTIYHRVQRKIGLKGTEDNQAKFLKNISENHYDLIYSNTVISIPFGNQIKQYNSQSKHIAHIHELQVIIQQILPDFKLHSEHVDHFIAASDLVKNNLSKNWDISPQQISRVYECSLVEIETKIKRSSKNKVFHVGGAGTVHWRKGSDLFIQVASYLKTLRPELDFKFTWVGAVSKNERFIHEEDIRKAGLEDNVFFTGPTNEPTNIFKEFDVFLMTSREDPFPLVCIEVGMLGKPILCFEGATGTQEIITKGGGSVISYLDTRQMAKTITEYIDSPKLLQEKGKINAQEFSEFSPDKICPQILEVLKLL